LPELTQRSELYMTDLRDCPLGNLKSLKSLKLGRAIVPLRDV